MSSLLSPPNAFDRSDSTASSCVEFTDAWNRLADLACLKNSFTIEGKHTYSIKRYATVTIMYLLQAKHKCVAAKRYSESGRECDTDL
jgi:hypothetical protein